MTPEIALVLFILLAAVILLVTEWIPMEATALLVMSCLALSGLVSHGEALAGFSNPAVVTVWAVFILSGGLTRAGLAGIIGRQVMRVAGRHEFGIILTIMLSAGCMSAVMNNVAVAALMLPVTMDISRQTRHPPSHLLMPLAYGCLLGGLTTQIGTPPNILVSEALRENGLVPFSLFDFTPIGLTVMGAGILFVALAGRHLLPVRNLEPSFKSGASNMDLASRYGLRRRLLNMTIPEGSVLAGRTLAESRLGPALGVNVVGITRGQRTILAPEAGTTLEAGDILVCGGPPEHLHEIESWSGLHVQAGPVDIRTLARSPFQIKELQLSGNSPLVGRSLTFAGFGTHYRVSILAIRRGEELFRAAARDQTLADGDRLLVLGTTDDIGALVGETMGLSPLPPASPHELDRPYKVSERLLEMLVPQGSVIASMPLEATRLGDGLGMRVLRITRAGGESFSPSPETILRERDTLLVEGRAEDLELTKALRDLSIGVSEVPASIPLESDEIGLMEAMLSPHTTLAGKTLQQLHFREKFGLTVLAIWREGKALHEGIREIPLRFGDALLTHGPREKMRMLAREPDFLVLTESAQESVRKDKLPVALCIMLAVLLPVVTGWVPIHIAVVAGAALMVLTRCLSMTEAYRFIEWKAVFLIAGMLPLGTALDQTGAAHFLAVKMVGMVGPFGPHAVMLAMLVLTFLATCIIPTAALVVLMAPIVLSTAADLGASPYPLMMAVAMAASASFMTPVAHPANILVMGPGGYRFLDYFRLGLPLTLLTMLILALVLPFFWPFQVVGS